MSRREERADEYAFAKASPVKRWAEEPTLLRAAGDLRGCAVLDLACGSGHYARRLKRAGAARVVGIDISHDMIAAAQAEEARQPLGIEYRAGDASGLAVLGSFDVVVAAYLFVYAETREVLQAMCRTVATNLAPRGRLVAAILNPDLDLAAKFDFERTGLLVERFDDQPGRDGAAVRVRIGADGGVYEVRDYLWSRDTYESCVREVGLTPTWHPLEPDAEGRRRLGDAFWEEILHNPPIAVFTARAALTSE
jgi:SAM-dependent methyltransferase